MAAALFTLQEADFKFEVVSKGAPAPTLTTKTNNVIAIQKTYGDDNSLELVLELSSYTSIPQATTCVDLIYSIFSVICGVKELHAPFFLHKERVKRELSLCAEYIRRIIACPYGTNKIVSNHCSANQTMVGLLRQFYEDFGIVHAAFY
jgi:hypothetical protein